MSCVSFVTAAVLYLVALSCPTLSSPKDCSPPDSSVHGDSPGKNTRVGYYALLQGIFPTQGSNPGLWVDSLLSEPPVKPENTGVGSLSLLQGNFLSQELNWGLLHCRQILYQLSYQVMFILEMKIHFKLIINPFKLTIISYHVNTNGIFL